MKTAMRNLVLAGLTVTTMSTNAWSQVAADTSKEINAQTTITRGAIDNLLEKVNRKTVNSQFKVDDYLDQSQEAKNKVEAAMKKFEVTLEKDVLAKASYWMDQYNSIYNSSDYSREQKNILLAQRLVNIKNQFAKLSVTYQAALREVYSLVPFAAVNYTFKTYPESQSYDTTKNTKETVKVEMSVNDKVKVQTTMDVVYDKGNDSYAYPSFIFNGKKRYVESYSDKNNFGVYRDSTKKSMGTIFGNERYDYDQIIFLETASKLEIPKYLQGEMYKKHIYSSIKGKCKSQICVGLKAGEYGSLLVLIKSLLDRQINLKLASGEYVDINNLALDTRTIESLLARVDYPEELPFEAE